MEKNDNYIELITKYLKNDATPDEEKLFLQLIESDSEYRLFFFKIKQIWELANAKDELSESSIEAEWQKLRKNIASEKNTDKRKFKNTQSPNRLLFSVLKLAAVLVFIAALTYFVQYGVGLHNVLSQQAQNQIEVPYGSKIKICLPDNTSVWLNAGSSIEYPSFVVGKTRQVKLSGEAYFEVAKNLERPFVIQTAELAIRVTGTTFNVKSYPNDSTAVVTLLNGGVNISSSTQTSAKQTYKLAPGQKATFSKNTRQIKLEQANVKQSTDWLKGIYSFDSTPLSEIVKNLSRTYNKKFIIEDSKLMNIKFTGTLDCNYSWEIFLKVLNANTNTKHVIKNDSIIIKN